MNVAPAALSLAFNPDVIMPAVVLGAMAAGLYGLMAVSLVLTYRVSRTIGFVHGGIALFAAFLYAFLTLTTGGGCSVGGSATSCIGPIPGTILVTAVGAGLGLIYGVTVTGKRMASWPTITLTTYSLAAFLILAGITFSFFSLESVRAPSAFGNGVHRVGSVVVTGHQLATLVIILSAVTVLSIVLKRSRYGVYVRAIADDVETTRLLGIPLGRIGVGVYAFSGGLAALSGVLITSTIGPDATNSLFILLRAMIACALGGFTSLGLAIVGSFILAILETLLIAGAIGTVQVEQREIIVMGIIFGLIFAINRLRPSRALEATGF